MPMSELYELPDGWEWKLIDDILDDIKTGTTPPKKEQKYYDNPTINWLAPSDFGEHKELNFSKNMINHISIVDKKAKVYPPNSLLLVAIGATIGKIGIIRKESSSNQQITAMKFKDYVDVDFSYYWFVRMKQKIIDSASTATLPIINQKGIKSLPFPLPPLQEQKRIVAKLDTLFEKIDKAIDLHQKNMDEADVFMGSVLNEVFGELEERYGKVPLFDVANVARGKSKHRPRNDKQLFGGKYPFIQTGDVRNANRYINSYSNTYSEFGLNQSKLWNKGTICMTIAANIGDVAVLEMDSCFPDSVVGIYSEKNSNEYLYFFLLTLKQQLESKATTTAQMNINLKVLQTIGVPLLYLETQQKTVKYLNQISGKTEKVKTIQKEKMENLKALKASILDRAFRGEL